MRNITTPRMVSFEEALRNLASRLTGVPTTALPRTQEGIVQFMAENLPPAAPVVDVDALAEAITTEVLARLANETADTGKDNTETNGDAQKLTSDGTETNEATKDTSTTENGSQKAAGAAKRNKNKSTD